MRSRKKEGVYFMSILKRQVLFVLFAFAATLCAFAQNKTITGLVVDGNGESIIGASVLVKGTTNGIITDIDGKFTLNDVPEAGVIQISYIGYKTQEISAKNKANLKVVLVEDNEMLDEVVVVGYGVQKKSDVTGAMIRVGSEELNSRPVANAFEAMQGKAAGVDIVSNERPGEVGTINVRGVRSLSASNTPLYVVDGIPLMSNSGIETLNPQDIESIDVLKDASATAIYGSRGANGVVLITTKMANKDDKVRVQFSAAFSIQQLEKKIDVLSPEEWITFRTAYNNSRYLAALGGKGATADDDWDTRYALNGNRVNYEYMNDPRWTQPGYGGLRLIDWQDEFYRLAPMQNYQLSVSNGRGNTQYRLSLGYIDQQGIAIESAYKRLNLRANVETKLYDRITLGVNMAPSMDWKDGGRVDGKDQQANQVLTMCPVAEPDAGIYSGAEPYASYLWSSTKISPIAYMEQVTNHIETARLNSSAFIRVNIIDGLRAEVKGAYDFTSRQTRTFTPSSVIKNWTDGEGYHSSANRIDIRSSKYLLQAVLNYDKKLGKHNIAAMAGYSMESSSGATTNLSAQQFPDNSLEVFNQSDEAIKVALATLSTPNRLLSYFGRAQYEYDNRYLLTASIRRDGSSRFGKNNRWGMFPAVSAAYRISNEKFWPEKFVVNQMKIRGSWGMNGNNSISTNAAIGLMGSSNYSIGGSLTNGFAPSSIDNKELGWEKTHSWNVGLDLGFFDNRITLAADYYDKTTKDLLYQVSVPGTMGFTQAWGNIGSIKNKGFEIELTTQKLTGRFKWTTSLNIAYNKNKVLSLGEDNSTVFIGWDKSNTQVLMVGQPLRAYYMYDAVGVYQYKEDLRKYPTMSNSIQGDVRYRDVNDDGKINDQDRTLVGKPDPDYTFGMTNTFKYKDFDLSVLLTGQTGGMIYSLLGRGMDRPGMGASINVLSRWKNMWVSEEQPGDGKTPGINNSNTGSLYDTRWLYSTDFIKIKNVTLGYRIPIKNKKIINYARVYISGENLLMWDKYEGGYSPEVNNDGKNSDYDYGSYPQARTITLGVNVTF